MRPCYVLLVAVSAFAQSAATYDSSRQVKLTGIVTKIDWANPHAFFFIDVKDAAGTVAVWDLD